ncbi:Carbon monoxide dehydrogenase medium chain [Pseudodesulfovibrio hydrargyri]|uniref:Carbon monoxide dehydrogenase medium chain n=1 Tax=Pseudodesulfovibrio hydrargyri TaxID=2125990 RepID=A0A1J5MYI5_9BACT|nr:FAD binding domain-containing protein [Pseudodesulfovibrio hydrargyri]OIQ50900.1 Carbon monoxide dehydrogenase medium chain [Pseudodesulfovibrio hydrargyri]
MVGYVPADLRDALRFAQAEAVTPLAGGTDLMVRFKAPAAMPATPLFLGALPELRGVTRKDEFLSIGACEPLAGIIANPAVPAVFRSALAQIGSPAIRNQGTLGGNVCNASPAGDSLPLLYLFRAEMVLASLEGERVVPLDRFITGPGRTLRQENELLVSIRIPDEFLSEPYVYVFEKMGNRKADAISKASFALRLAVEEGVVRDVDAAFGAMGPKVALMTDSIRAMCLGKTFPLADLDRGELKNELYGLLTPIDDQRSTAAYRKRVALNLLYHYLTTDSTHQR